MENFHGHEVETGTSVFHKSDLFSKQHREHGNNCYGCYKWMESLMFYNKAIAYANSKESLSLAYANRSAIYLELELYDECLKNIQWAKEHDYPTEKMPKLIERENKCKKELSKAKKPDDTWAIFKLSYPANEKIPWVADCVEMRRTEKYGRGIYAKSDLKAGDIISIEEPFIYTCKRESLYRHCFNCSKSCSMNLIPCDQSASLMFCSEDCKDDLYSKTDEFKDILQLFTKILLKVGEKFGGKENLDRFLDGVDLKSLKSTIFDYDFSDPKNKKSQENLAICFLSLNAAETAFGRMLENRSKDVDPAVVKHLVNVNILNNMACSYSDARGDIFEDGVCIPLFGSLLNHSCDPNVYRIMADNKVVIFVCRPIKAGEQIFCHYTGNIGPWSEKSKLKFFEENKFTCECKYCVEKIPIPMISDPIVHQLLATNKYKKVEEYLKKGFEYLNSDSKNNFEISKYKIGTYMGLKGLAYRCAFSWKSLKN